MEKYRWIQSINTYLYIVERINEHFNRMRRTSEHDEIEEEAFYLCIEILRMIPFPLNENSSQVKIMRVSKLTFYQMFLMIFCVFL